MAKNTTDRIMFGLTCVPPILVLIFWVMAFFVRGDFETEAARSVDPRTISEPEPMNEAADRDDEEEESEPNPLLRAWWLDLWLVFPAFGWSIPAVGCFACAHWTACRAKHVQKTPYLVFAGWGLLGVSLCIIAVTASATYSSAPTSPRLIVALRAMSHIFTVLTLGVGLSCFPMTRWISTMAALLKEKAVSKLVGVGWFMLFDLLMMLKFWAFSYQAMSLPETFRYFVLWWR